MSCRSRKGDSLDHAGGIYRVWSCPSGEHAGNRRPDGSDKLSTGNLEP